MRKIGFTNTDGKYMRTPAKFKKNLKDGIITEEMLDAALHSVNKRAKNWRNRKRRLKRFACSFSEIHNAEAREKNLYDQKEILLKLLKPVCIHEEFAGFKRTRVYDYEKNYDKIYSEKLEEERICWENYYIKTMRDGIDQVVCFFDYFDPDVPEYRYYLFYECGKNSYHLPINKEDLDGYDLPIKSIGQLDTCGEDPRNLISLSFVGKILVLIESGRYVYVPK